MTLDGMIMLFLALPGLAALGGTFWLRASLRSIVQRQRAEGGFAPAVGRDLVMSQGSAIEVKLERIATIQEGIATAQRSEIETRQRWQEQHQQFESGMMKVLESFKQSNEDLADSIRSLLTALR